MNIDSSEGVERWGRGSYSVHDPQKAGRQRERSSSINSPCSGKQSKHTSQSLITHLQTELQVARWMSAA
ncbi:MAG: hypothetical protein ACHP8A_15090, partial [Terriglobales bacterium]